MRPLTPSSCLLTRGRLLAQEHGGGKGKSQSSLLRAERRKAGSMLALMYLREAFIIKTQEWRSQQQPASSRTQGTPTRRSG